MRHRRAGVHLSRTSAHRKALFSNLVAALLTNERIRTTDAKAKETRRLAERTITWARRVGDILSKKAERRSVDESARVVHAMRMARRVVRDRSAVTKLFDEIAPRFLSRRGGYTRLVKIGQRPGDAAPMSLLELMPDELPKRSSEGGGDKGDKKSKAPSAQADKGGGEASGGKAKARAKKPAEATAAAAGAGKKKSAGAKESAKPAGKSGKSAAKPSKTDE